jgi:hypothetical protein
MPTSNEPRGQHTPSFCLDATLFMVLKQDNIGIIILFQV